MSTPWWYGSTIPWGKIGEYCRTRERPPWRTCPCCPCRRPKCQTVIWWLWQRPVFACHSRTHNWNPNCANRNGAEKIESMFIHSSGLWTAWFTYNWAMNGAKTMVRAAIKMFMTKMRMSSFLSTALASFHSIFSLELDIHRCSLNLDTIIVINSTPSGCELVRREFCEISPLFGSAWHVSNLMAGWIIMWSAERIIYLWNLVQTGIRQGSSVKFWCTFYLDDLQHSQPPMALM